MSKLKTKATQAITRMINFEVDTPRCYTCKNHYQKREDGRMYVRCMKYDFRNDMNGLCDFWEDRRTGQGLAS